MVVQKMEFPNQHENMYLDVNCCETSVGSERREEIFQILENLTNRVVPQNPLKI